MFEFKHRKSPIEKDIDVIDDDAFFEVTIRRQVHLKNFYKDLWEWLCEHEYYDAETGSGNKFETLYWEFIKPGNVSFHHIWWRVLKNPRKSNNAFRYFMKLNIKTLVMTNVETMVEGQKFKTYSGEVTTYINTYVQIDPDDKWSKHPILKYFEKVLVERWFKKQTDYHKHELYQDMLAIHRRVKQFLGGRVEVPMTEGWRNTITGL